MKFSLTLLALLPSHTCLLAQSISGNSSDTTENTTPRAIEPRAPRLQQPQPPPFIRDVTAWIHQSDRLPFLSNLGHFPVSYEKWMVMDIALWLASRNTPVDCEVSLYQNLRCDLEYMGDTFVEFKADNRQLNLGRYFRSIRDDVAKLARSARGREKIVVGVAFAYGIWQGLPRVLDVMVDEDGRGTRRRRVAPDANERNYMDELRRVYSSFHGVGVFHELVRKRFRGQNFDFVVTWAVVP